MMIRSGSPADSVTNPMPSARSRHGRNGFATSVLVLAATLSVLAYWTGLTGPFLLDDMTSLADLDLWSQGKATLAQVIFGDSSGMLGRPLSMASFALSVWLGGFSPFSLKLGNLVLHLGCGGLIFLFLRRLLHKEPRLAAHAAWLAAIVAALWLLHPLHVSTVLYAVQRMAQLSALLVLVGLWVYLVARDRLQRSPSRAAGATILVVVPGVTLLAAFAKENGALLPLLCALIELVWFNRERKPWSVRVFLLGVVALPLLLAGLTLLVRPDLLLHYEGREFNLIERVLSQARALCDYLGSLLAPNPPRMGIFTDDFAISTSVWNPPTTLPCILLLLGLSALAWRGRRRVPAASFGWFFFLAAHAMESGIFALELYFEHRNYLPSVGILLAVVALGSHAATRLATHRPSTRLIGMTALAALCAILAFSTHGRARVWKNPVLLAESSLMAHPYSLRANALVLDQSIALGDLARAHAIADQLANSPTARHQALARAWRLHADCALAHQGQATDLDAFVDQTPTPLGVNELRLLRTLFDDLGRSGCGTVTDAAFGRAIARLLDQTAPDSGMRLPLHTLAANALVRAGEWSLALPHATAAWQTDAPATAALPLFLAQMRLGDRDGAGRTLAQAALRAETGSEQDRKAVAWMREVLQRNTALPHAM